MNKPRRRIILSIAFIAIILLASCLIFLKSTPAVSAAASISKQKMTIGDSVNYLLVVTADKNADVIVSGLDKAFERFTVRDRKAIKKTGIFRIRDEYRYAFTKYRPGEYVIPEVTVQYTGPGPLTSGRLRTRAFKITVDSVLKDIKIPEPGIKFESSMAGAGRYSRPEAPRRAEGPIRYPIKDIPGPRGLMTYQDMSVIASAVALGAFIIILSVVLIRRKYLKKKILHPKPPHQITLAKLRDLSGRKLHENHRMGDLCLELSAIMREYVQSRFGIESVVMTTREFLNTIDKIEELTDMHKGYLKDLVVVCDLVKYAQYTPKEGELDTSLERERKFVEETMPVGDEEKKA